MNDKQRMIEMFGLASNSTARDITAPKGGEAWSVFDLEPYTDQAQEARQTKSWKGVPRHIRQNGKISAAQHFRRAQGYYLKARLHFWKISQSEAGYLRWWFQDLERVLIHHVIMINYYLEDAPTTLPEILDHNICGAQKVKGILKTAVEMGSLEVDQLKSDRRVNVYYVTRGLVAESDMLFGRKADGDPNREGIYRHWNRNLHEDPDRGEEYKATPQMLDKYLTQYDAYFEMVSKFLPDMDEGKK
jgi:hypothetical protein